jgi:hypothetical protein
MRTGVTVAIFPADIDRPRALVGKRNAPQKHVWRAQIVLLSAEGLRTNAIMRERGKAKTCVWRWQERFAAEGFDGLLRDKTRRSRIPKLNSSVAERVVALTIEAPPGETTHWASGARTGFSRTASGNSSSPRIPNSSTNCATSSASMSTRPRTP